MKKYTCFLLTSLLLLTACSQNNSSLPTPSETSEEVTRPEDSKEIDLTSSQQGAESPEEIYHSQEDFKLFLTNLTTFLEEFDIIYRRMEESAPSLTENETPFDSSDYLTDVRAFIDLLYLSETMIAPQALQENYETFAKTSSQLIALYKELEEFLLEAETQTEIPHITENEPLFSLISTKIPLAIEDFSNSAFELMVSLEQTNLAG